MGLSIDLFDALNVRLIFEITNVKSMFLFLFHEAFDLFAPFSKWNQEKIMNISVKWDRMFKKELGVNITSNKFQLQ